MLFRRAHDPEVTVARRFQIAATCLATAFLLSSCGGGDFAGGDPSASSGSGCDGSPEGAYQCSGNAISVCKGGNWEYATSCTCTIYDGDPRKPPYPSRCNDATSTPGGAE